MTEPTTDERLAGLIQLAADIGNVELIVELTRLREQVAEFKDAYYKENLEKQRLRNQLKAANAVYEWFNLDDPDRWMTPSLRKKLEAYRATQKGGAEPKPADPGNVLLGKALFGDGRRR